MLLGLKLTAIEQSAWLWILLDIELIVFIFSVLKIIGFSITINDEPFNNGLSHNSISISSAWMMCEYKYIQLAVSLSRRRKKHQHSLCVIQYSKWKIITNNNKLHTQNDVVFTGVSVVAVAYWLFPAKQIQKRKGKNK